MFISLLKSKIHNATVTEANLLYSGSITISRDLMNASGIIENEKVSVYDVTNGARLSTYVIPGDTQAGYICLNGAAAKLIKKGDKVIICSYCMVKSHKAAKYKPKIIIVDDNNKIINSK